MVLQRYIQVILRPGCLDGEAEFIVQTEKFAVENLDILIVNLLDCSNPMKMLSISSCLAKSETKRDARFGFLRYIPCDHELVIVQ